MYNLILDMSSTRFFYFTHLITFSPHQHLKKKGGQPAQFFLNHTHIYTIICRPGFFYINNLSNDPTEKRTKLVGRSPNLVLAFLSSPVRFKMEVAG